VSLTLPTGHRFVQFLKVDVYKSTMYPVAQAEQFFAKDTHPEQLTSQGEHLFKVVSAKVPNGQFVEETQVFVLVLRKKGEEHDVQIIESELQVEHEVLQL
jgi:hypothetical protein